MKPETNVFCGNRNKDRAGVRGLPKHLLSHCEFMSIEPADTDRLKFLCKSMDMVEYLCKSIERVERKLDVLMGR